MKIHYGAYLPILALFLFFVSCEDPIQQYYELEHLFDVDVDDEMDYQEVLKTNSKSICNETSYLDVESNATSFFMIIVYYHTSFGYELTETHQLYTEPDDDPYYRHGFWARYHHCDGSCSNEGLAEDDPIVESGTVTIKQENSRLEMEFDIFFTDGSHEEGHWLLEQCGDIQTNW